MNKEYEFLLDRFDYNDEEEGFVSKKTLLGASTGSDKKLILFLDDSTTFMYWRDGRGYETTIFDGIGLEEEDIELTFNLLGINSMLRWKTK